MKVGGRHLQEADGYWIEDDNGIGWSVGEHVDHRIVRHGELSNNCSVLGGNSQ